MQDIQSVSTASNPRRFSFDTLAVWALTGTLALAAVLFIPQTSIPFVYSKVSVLALGALIALAFYILARLTRGNIIVPPARLIGAFWFVPVAYLLSTLFSGGGFRLGLFGSTFENDTLGFMLILAFIASLAALIFRRSNQYRVFFKTGFVVFAVIVVVQILFLLLGQLSSKIVAPTANLVGSFADLGMVVGLGISVSLLALRFLSLSDKVRRIVFIVSGLGLCVLAIVNSNLIWALTALVALGLFIEAIMRRVPVTEEEDIDGMTSFGGEETSRRMESSETKNLAAPLVTLVFALFFLIGGGTIGATLTNAFGASYLDVRPSWQSTFNVGGHTYASSPLFGSGPNTFVEEWLKFHDRALNDTVFWSIDFTSGIGLIPTSFITTGLVGALAWIAFLFLFLYVGIRALLFKTPEEGFARFTAIASFVGAWYVFLLSIFTIPGPIVLATGFFLAGLFVSALRYGGSRREWGIVFSKNPRIGFVIVFTLTILLLVSVVASYVVIERYLATVSYTKAQSALSSGDVALAETLASRALLFASSDRAYQVLATTGIAKMNKIANDTTLSPSQAQQQFQAALSGSIQAALSATKENPNNYQNYVLLGNVYQTVVPLNIDGAYQNAKDAYERAIVLNPLNPTLPYIVAQLEIAQKNGPAAEESLTKAINLKHDYTQAIFLLSQLEVQLGKAKEALQAAEAAAYFAPNDPNVLFQVGILRSGTGDVDGAISALSRAVEQNPQYANARFFLAVSYASKGSYDKALEQLQEVSNLSAENAQAVSGYITTLRSGKNPFPQSRQGALGIPQTPVMDTSTKTTTTPPATTAPQN
jgi:tetratricopeptide (TPR) repeat protein